MAEENEPNRPPEENEDFGLAALFPKQEAPKVMPEVPLSQKSVGPSLFRYGKSKPKSQAWKWLVPALALGLILVLLIAFWDSLPFSVWTAGDPDVASEAIFQTAKAAKEDGNSKAALSEFRRLVRKYPHTDRARVAEFQLGELERQLKESMSALERYGAVIATKGDDSLALEAHLRRAEIYFGFGKNQEGIAELTPFWMDSLKSRKAFEARLLAASTLASMGQEDSALILYEAVARADTGGWYKIQVRKNLARIYEGKGDFPAAKAQYDAIAKYTPEQDPLHQWALEQSKAMKEKGREKK